MEHSYAELAAIGRKKMKLALSELHPNPFKKEINHGKMNEEQIKKLLANLDKLNLMGQYQLLKGTINIALFLIITEWKP
jgi:hypothetical protein